ncbi:MAG TPA: alpha/beta hydrolase [Chitinophagaceae bacterium]|nr:alpha/beta hydrolase [Chitinophagaceae bacterium]
MTRKIMLLLLTCFTTVIVTAQSPVKKYFPDNTVFHENINYAGDTLKKHLLDIYLPPHASRLPPLIIWIHGGAWMLNDKYADMGYMKNTVREFIEKGYALASIDYRHSTTKPFPAMVQDCNRAIQYLYNNASKYGYDKNRITLVGFSAGGHLASLIALAGNNKMNDFYFDGKPGIFKISSVVDFYGPADFLAFGSDTSINKPSEPITILLGAAPVDRPDLARRASPVTYVDKGDPPFLIIQGEKDASVPNTQSRYLNSWLRLAGVQSKLIMVPGAPHYGEMFDAEWIRREVFSFLEQTLKKQ